MIVYGDPQFEIESSLAARQLRERIQRAGSCPVDCARDFLIGTGQIEQAIADAGLDSSAITRATDLGADYFVRNLLEEALVSESNPLPLEAAAECIGAALENLDRVRIKLPEGFAFYTLYPEQYCEAALAWLRSREATRVLVIGIRSIGTTLSAVVKATLNARGWDAARVTVRPIGHPFDRAVELPADLLVETAIVVDEGPGLSGSSMACVARALLERGVRDVTFFPGHDQPPGAVASEDVRRIWSGIPTIVFPAITSDISRSRLVQSLRATTGKLLDSPVARIVDLSAGKWRALPGFRSIEATPELERAKYLFRCENGRAVLWKFAGLGPGRCFEPLGTVAFRRQSHLAAAGWCPPPLGMQSGFIATEWIGGPPLAPSDLSEPMIDHLARYIAFSAREPLGPSEQGQSLARLADMTQWNFQKAGLNSTAPPTPIGRQALRGCGDGRLAPHEWIRAGDKILKTDTWGHEFDHTIIGPQSILWDIAGAIVEWRMTPAQIAQFLQALGRTGALPNEIPGFCPEGTNDNGPALKHRVRSIQRAGPEGTTEPRGDSVVPSGLGVSDGAPGVETPGCFQASLRDAQRQILLEAGVPTGIRASLHFHIAAYCAFRIGTASLAGDQPALDQYTALARDRFFG